MDSRSSWGLALGGVGLIVGIVALVLAIGAKNDASSEAEVSQAVRQEAAEAVGQLRQNLQKGIRNARASVQQLQAGVDEARRTARAVGDEQTSERRQIQSLRSSISSAQSDISTLQNEVSGLNRQLTQVEQSIQRINQRLDRTR